MIVDYYSILKAKPFSGQFRIAYNYRKLMKENLLGNDEGDKDSLRKVCEAYSVLGSENVRKYYDILYEDSLIKQGRKLNNDIVFKYSDIVDHYASEGAIVAGRILEDPVNGKYSAFTSSLVYQFLIRGLWSSYGGASIIYTGSGGILFLIFGIMFFIRLTLNYDVSALIGALTLSVIGLTVIFNNFRQFTIADTKRIVQNIKLNI